MEYNEVIKGSVETLKDLEKKLNKTLLKLDDFISNFSQIPDEESYFIENQTAILENIYERFLECANTLDKIIKDL